MYKIQPPVEQVLRNNSIANEKQPSRFRKWLGKTLQIIGTGLKKIGQFIKYPFPNNNKWRKIFGVTIAIGLTVGAVATTVASGGAAIPVIIPLIIELTAAVAGYIVAKKNGAITGSFVATNTASGSHSNIINSIGQNILPDIGSIASQQTALSIIGGVAGMATGIGIASTINHVCRTLTGHNIDTTVGNTLLKIGNIINRVGRIIADEPKLAHSPSNNSNINIVSEEQSHIKSMEQFIPSKYQPIIKDIQTIIEKNQDLPNISSVNDTIKKSTMSKHNKDEKRSNTI